MGGVAMSSRFWRQARTASGDIFEMVVAASRRLVLELVAGTTRDTMPCRSASSASSTRHVSTRSLTRPGPHIWNRRAVPPESGISPCASSGRRNLASSAAIRTSHNKARSNMPPMHQPWIAHTTGTFGGTRNR